MGELSQFVQIREARRLEDQAQVEQAIMESILVEHPQLDRIPEQLDEWLDLEATYRYRVVEQFTRFSERLTPQQREDLADRLKSGGLFASLEQLR